MKNKQESGGWEEKWNKEFEMEQILIPITARKMKKFVKKELQEAERRGVMKAFDWIWGRWNLDFGNIDRAKKQFYKLLKK